MGPFAFLGVQPRETGCSHLGGCSISEVNKPNMESQGQYLSIFISFVLFLVNKTNKQVFSLQIGKKSECVNWFRIVPVWLRATFENVNVVFLTKNAFSFDQKWVFK